MSIETKKTARKAPQPVRVQRSVGLLPDAANLIREDILWHQGRRGSSGKTPDFEVGFIEGMYQAHGLILKLMKQPNEKVRDGGPVASDCNRDAIPPFSAPSC